MTQAQFDFSQLWRQPSDDLQNKSILSYKKYDVKALHYNGISIDINHSILLSANQPLKLMKGNKFIGDIIHQLKEPKLTSKDLILNNLHQILNNSHQTLDSLHKTLDHLHEECAEEGFEVFSEVARNNARKVLDFLYNHFPQYEYDIYPTEDREVAIHCNPQKGRGGSILCDSEGDIAYFITIDGRNSRFRCNHLSEFPFKVLKKKFTELYSENVLNHQNYSTTSLKSNLSLSSENPIATGTDIYDKSA